MHLASTRRPFDGIELSDCHSPIDSDGASPIVAMIVLMAWLQGPPRG